MLRFRADRPDWSRVGSICHPPFIDCPTVDADNVSLLEHASAGDAMYQLFVHSDSDRCRKWVAAPRRIAQEGRSSTPLFDDVVRYLVESVRGHTWTYRLTNAGQHLIVDLRCILHRLDVGAALQDDRHTLPNALLLPAVSS